MSVTLNFSTKAQNLRALQACLRHGKVLPQFEFNFEDWSTCREQLLADFRELVWSKEELIVRSSAASEDSAHSSQAGRFHSEMGVRGEEELVLAVEKVFASYPQILNQDEVLIQPMLTSVKMAGVAFTRDSNTTGPYYVINYDDHSGKTDTVTGGKYAELKTYFLARSSQQMVRKKFAPLIQLLKELEALFDHRDLDVEFVVDAHDQLYLLQVRPLCLGHYEQKICTQAHTDLLRNIESKVNSLIAPHPYLFGEKSVLGVMPDWNPAEIIGLRPSPFSMSLYKEIITDFIWAFQRNNYGYKNLRSFPLMMDLGGMPFIDVRVSFNSFLPADLSDTLSEKLVNHYIDQLIQSPDHHDKVEFEIIYSCFSLDLEERLQKLAQHGFTEEERGQLAQSLKRLTNKIIKEDGLWTQDLNKISLLEEKRKKILASSLKLEGKIYWLLEDCKRYGSLPFAGLARAGFIAMQMLDSLVSLNLLSAEEKQLFLVNLDTISGQIVSDFHLLDFPLFLQKYGHLRPGTYDPLSLRYDEAPEKYFDQMKKEPLASHSKEKFGLSLAQLNAIKKTLDKVGLDLEVIELFNFIKAATEAREYSKFIFTKNVSDAISLFVELAASFGFSREDCAFADIGVISRAQSNCRDLGEVLAHSIREGKKAHQLTQQLVLPPLIVAAEEIWEFEMPPVGPNFITLKQAQGKVASLTAEKNDLAGAILFVPNADPGHDWIFAKGIAGLITKYGGANSHMAIRASELGIPAVIGSGEMLYQKWSNAKVISLDCSNKQVQVIQ